MERPEVVWNGGASWTRIPGHGIARHETKIGVYRATVTPRPMTDAESDESWIEWDWKVWVGIRMIASDTSLDRKVAMREAEIAVRQHRENENTEEKPDAH